MLLTALLKEWEQYFLRRCLKVVFGIYLLFRIVYKTEFCRLISKFWGEETESDANRLHYTKR